MTIRRNPRLSQPSRQDLERCCPELFECPSCWNWAVVNGTCRVCGLPDGGKALSLQGEERGQKPKAVSEPLECVTLHFGYDPAAFRRAGCDLSTSEGKATLKELLLSALSYYGEAIEGHTCGEFEGPLIEALLSEGS